MKAVHALWTGLLLHAPAYVAHGQQQNSIEVAPPNDPNAEVPSPRAADSREQEHLGLSIEYRRMFGHGYRSSTQGRLGLEVLEDDRHGLGLFIFGGLLELEEGSSTHDAAYDPAVAGFGFGYRYYFTHRRTFVRPYVGVEGQFLWIAWEYRDALVFDDETIRFDSTEGADGYLGFGVVLGYKRVNLFGEIGAGGGFFAGGTSEGLHNDLFGAYGYIGVRVGLTVRF